MLFSAHAPQSESELRGQQQSSPQRRELYPYADDDDFFGNVERVAPKAVASPGA